MCGRDIDLTSINTDTQKGSTSVANKESPRNLEFMPLVVSLSDLYKTNKKLFIQSEAKTQQNDISISVEKTLETPPPCPSLKH